MKKAFTIVEIAIVLALMIILSVVVSAVIKSVSKQYLGAAVHKMVSDISYAQSLAVNKREWYGIKFNAAANSYYIYSYNMATAQETLVQNPAKLGTNFQIYLGVDYTKISISQVHCDSVLLRDYILFSADGVPSASDGAAYAATCEVQVSHESGDNRWIYVSPQTGKVNFN